MTQNNLGEALAALAGRNKGPEAAAYLEQAVTAYRDALQVRTEADLPTQWLQTMINLARTYELQRDWNNARQSYGQLLRHDPSNADWKAKIRDLGKSSHFPATGLSQRDVARISQSLRISLHARHIVV